MTAYKYGRQQIQDALTMVTDACKKEGLEFKKDYTESESTGGKVTQFYVIEFADSSRKRMKTPLDFSWYGAESGWNNERYDQIKTECRLWLLINFRAQFYATTYAVPSIKRIFVEDDEELRDDEFTTSFRRILLMGVYDTNQTPEQFFSEIVVDALNETQKTWAAIKASDEIYVSTALIPMYGFGSNYGSGMLFNSMMHQAIEEKVEGKKLFILREYKGVQWGELRKSLVDKCFKKNYLYVVSDDGNEWEQVDIDKLLKEI